MNAFNAKAIALILAIVLSPAVIAQDVDWAAIQIKTHHVAGIELAIEIAGPNTKIIPGHGQITDKAMLRAVRDMLVRIRDRIQSHINQGKSVKETVAAKPTAEYDERWGTGGFFTPDQFVEIIYQELASSG